MQPITPALTGLMLLFLAACQTVTPSSSQQLYHQQEQSARDYLEQKHREQIPDSAAAYPDSPGTQADTSAVSIRSVYQAQRLALLHSPGIAVIFADLGIHQASTVQQQLLQNPGLELSLMRPETGGRWQMEFSLSLGLLDWLSRQQRVQLANAENARWQAQAWQQLSDELTNVRNLWLASAAAQQKLAIHRELYESASVSADFAALLFEAGNISELELLSNQSMAGQRQARMIQAELAAQTSLTALQHALGLDHTTPIFVPDQLPVATPSAAALDSQQLMQLAQSHQPALQLSKLEVQQTEQALALALRQTALRDAGLELITERESDGQRQHGLALSLSAPVFDNGDTRLSSLHGSLHRSRIQQQQIESATTASIHTALQEIHSSLQQLNLLETDELPRFRRMMSLSVEEYNFMLRGTFELLTVADLMLDARLRQVDATQQYWTAYSALENLLGTRIPETQHD